MIKKTNPSRLMVAYLLIAVFIGCSRDNVPRSELQVQNAYMYAPAPGQVHGAVYLALNNTGSDSRQLVDIAADVAGSAMVHRTVYENGMMKMRHVHHLSVEPGETLLFEPNGYHIMLVDLEGVPEVGSEFEIRLAFDRGETVTVPVAVKTQH